MNTERLLLTGMGVLCLAKASLALPTLQLDIGGGEYDPATETIVSADNPFTVYALIDGGIDPGAVYYLSAAIVPKQGPIPGDFGNFTVDGILASIAEGNMDYGTPPVDDPVFNPVNIGGHGIYDTWFHEWSFVPDPLKTAAAYNSQDNPGGLSPGSDLIYEDFAIDTTGLTEGFQVHFDFYTVGQGKVTRRLGTRSLGTQILDFAPFSHDAESTTSVSDSGSTLVLISVVMGLLGFLRRRLRD